MSTVNLVVDLELEVVKVFDHGEEVADVFRALEPLQRILENNVLRGPGLQKLFVIKLRVEHVLQVVNDELSVGNDGFFQVVLDVIRPRGLRQGIGSPESVLEKSIFLKMWVH